MYQKIFIMILLLIGIVGCGPENSAELPPADSTSESALSPVEENDSVTSVAPADSVDLGQIAPESGTEGDNENEFIVQPAPGIPDAEAKMVQLASQHLADRLGIDIGEVIFISAVYQDWPDSSLGCPAPDLLYAAVITPGFEIILEADGQNYSYHTDMVENVVLCVDDRPAEN